MNTLLLVLGWVLAIFVGLLGLWILSLTITGRIDLRGLTFRLGPSPVRQFWLAVVMFLAATGLAFMQSPRPDTLRAPRKFISSAWWRYPLEWNAASRLPKIECGLNAISITPGTNQIWVAGNNGMIVTSTDAGRTWTKKSIAAGQGAWGQIDQEIDRRLEAAYNNGITDLSDKPAPRSSGLPSIPGAPTPKPTQFVSSTSPLMTPSYVESLVAIDFSDELRGEAMGDRGTRFTTTDGGVTWLADDAYLNFDYAEMAFAVPDNKSARMQWWTDRGGPLQTFSYTRPFRPSSVARNSKHFWVIPSGGLLFRFGPDRNEFISRDFIGGLFSGLYFLANETNGWAVTKDASIFRTNDGGLTWQRSPLPTSGELSSVFFIDEKRGWVISANGSILSTLDGGTTWSQKPSSGISSKLNSINFLSDAQHGWIAGNDGLILSTEDGGDTWVHRTQGLEGNGGRYFRFPAPWYFLSLCLVALLMWRRIKAPDAEPEESVADVLVSDRPLEEPAGDVLGFDAIARGLSRFLRNENTKPPLTIAITGEWGTGKSSLMNLLRADLRSYQFRPVWFNAWHHQKEEHMLASLLENIKLQAVPRWWTARGMIFRARLLKIRGWRHWGPLLLLLFLIYVMLIYQIGHHGNEANIAALVKYLLSPFSESSASPAAKGSYLSLVTLLAGVAAFLGAVWRGITAFGVKPASLLAGVSRGVSIRGLEAQTSFRQKFAVEFNDVTQALGQRSMLIFIDDLDRCRPENVSETLEAVNFLTTSGECFVAIGMARTYVERCVGRAFKEVAEEMIDNPEDQGKSGDEVAKEKRIEFAKQYLDKLINIEVPVPAPNQPQSLALLVASTKYPERTEPNSGWQRLKVFVATFVEKYWRLAPAVLLLGGLLFLGYYIAMSLRSVGSVIQPSASPTPAPTPRASPNPSPTPGASPRPTSSPAPVVRSTPLEPGVLNQPPELTAGGRALLSPILLPLVALLVLIWIGSTILTRRPGLVVEDSPRFVAALEIWHPLVFARKPTPRATKRFMNHVRYLAMRQRQQSDSDPPLKQFLAKLKGRLSGGKTPEEMMAEMVNAEPAIQQIPDEVLVALAALQHLNPECLTEQPGPASSPDKVWPRAISATNPLRPLFEKAQEAHEAKFGNWAILSQYRERFLEMTSNVRVR